MAKESLCEVVALLTATPLFHVSFLPDLVQVNFLPLAISVAPALVHGAPALGAAAFAGLVSPNVMRASRSDEVANVRCDTRIPAG